jgi:hypothetical protein
MERYAWCEMDGGALVDGETIYETDRDGHTVYGGYAIEQLFAYEAACAISADECKSPEQLASDLAELEEYRKTKLTPDQFRKEQSDER